MSLYKRIGVILPSTNTTVESDFFKMSPDGVTVHFHRILRKSGLIGDYEIQEEMNRISQRLENKSFVDRAPKEIVEQEKTNYNNLQNDIKKISLTVKNL